MIVDRIPPSDRHNTLIQGISTTPTTTTTNPSQDIHENHDNTPQSRAKQAIRHKFNKPVIIKMIKRHMKSNVPITTISTPTISSISHHHEEKKMINMEEKQKEIEENEKKMKEGEAFQESLRV